jgi:two-component system sensor histidine kinase CpxA
MSGLINGLLLFSKAQIGGSDLHLKPVNVADTARRVVEREAPPESLIEMHVEEQLEVIANSEYLFCSLANVVRNAVRYAGDFGPITISAKNGGRHVTITVADNGPGLPESELDQVFKPSYRPEFARQREMGGVGLGLAIVRNCIEACDGNFAAGTAAHTDWKLKFAFPRHKRLDLPVWVKGEIDFALNAVVVYHRYMPTCNLVYNSLF